MDWPNWIIAGASVVNVIVLVIYAVSTHGIRLETKRQAEETRRQAELTAELSRQAKEGFRLQVLVAYQEEIRSARDQSASRERSIALMEQALSYAFPNEWLEIRKILEQAADGYKRQRA
jgi:uncharacterized membrane protein